MFLDDGISRDSAPDNKFLTSSLGPRNGTVARSNGVNGNANKQFDDKGVDPRAANKFSKVVIKQVRAF